MSTGCRKPECVDAREQADRVPGLLAQLAGLRQRIVALQLAFHAAEHANREHHAKWEAAERALDVERGRIQGLRSDVQVLTQDAQYLKLVSEQKLAAAREGRKALEARIEVLRGDLQTLLDAGAEALLEAQLEAPAKRAEVRASPVAPEGLDRFERRRWDVAWAAIRALEREHGTWLARSRWPTPAGGLRKGPTASTGLAVVTTHPNWWTPPPKGAA